MEIFIGYIERKKDKTNMSCETMYIHTQQFFTGFSTEPEVVVKLYIHTYIKERMLSSSPLHTLQHD